MRVLHLTDRLSGRGGADQHLLAVAKQQQRRGMDIAFAVGRIDPDFPLIAPTQVIPGLDARQSAPVALSCGPFDILHVHNLTNPQAIALGDLMTVQDHRAFCPGQGKWTRAGQPCALPMSPSLCADCFDPGPYQAAIIALTQTRLQRLRALRVTVLSRYMQTELAALNVPSSVIPPFIHNLPARAPASGPPCVLFVGRLVTAKGVWDAVKVWRQARIDLPLVFAGTGRERAALEQAGFEVTGWLDRPELAATYARAAALIMPSRWQEPFGIVGLEAHHCGVPIVAWDSGGVRDWYPGTPTPYGNHAALAAALQAAIGRRVSPLPAFAPEPLMDRLDALYDEVQQHPRTDPT